MITFCCSALQRLRSGETHVLVHCTFINLVEELKEETLIFWVPASKHFMF